MQKFWDPAESSLGSMPGLVDCLATSSRPLDQQQRRPLCSLTGSQAAANHCAAK